MRRGLVSISDANLRAVAGTIVKTGSVVQRKDANSMGIRARADQSIGSLAPVADPTP
jgi:hypothetical protein